MSSNQEFLSTQWRQLDKRDSSRRRIAPERQLAAQSGHSRSRYAIQPYSATSGRNALAQPKNGRDVQIANKTKDQLTNVEFGQRIGKGTFGTVYTVNVTKNNQQMELACKILKPTSDTRLSPSQRWHNFEGVMKDSLLVSSHKNLNHKNIVKIMGMICVPDRETGFPYSAVLMFFELCDGDLHDLLANTPPYGLLPENECRHWFKQIANGLKYLHDNRVVHLGIKPRNIFYVYTDTTHGKSLSQNPFDMNFKLGDFGHYAGNHSLQTKSCDIYGLGATLARSLIGRNKFKRHGCNIHNSMNQQTSKAKYKPKDWNLSKEVSLLVAQMTNPRHDWRPTIDDVLTQYDWLNSKITNPIPVRQSEVTVHNLALGKKMSIMPAIMILIAFGATYFLASK